MVKQYVDAAIIGEPLMSLWPIATVGYLYSLESVNFPLYLLLLLIPLGSVSYFELTRVNEHSEQDRELNKTQSKASSNPQLEDQEFSDQVDTLSEIVPVSSFFVVGINFLIGMWIFISDLAPIVISGTNDIYLTALFVFPLARISRRIWKMIHY